MKGGTAVKMLALALLAIPIALTSCSDTLLNTSYESTTIPSETAHHRKSMTPETASLAPNSISSSLENYDLLFEDRCGDRWYLTEQGQRGAVIFYKGIWESCHPQCVTYDETTAMYFPDEDILTCAGFWHDGDVLYNTVVRSTSAPDYFYGGSHWARDEQYYESMWFHLIEGKLP